MESLFTIILFLNIPIALASFVFAYIILRRGRNPIYFNFGMAVLFLALWIVSILLLFFRILPLPITFFLNLSFLFGIWILHYFLIFTIKFPVASPGNRFKINLLYLFTFLVSVTCFIPNLYAIEGRLEFPFLYISIGPMGLSIYTIYFVILVSLAFKNLIRKYLQSDGIFKTQLKKIILGTATAIFFNLLFSITIYFFITFNTTPIGVLFIFTVLLYIYSILFSKNAE